MDKNKLLGIMKTNGDRQEDLANAIGISRITLSAKLHNRNAATFTQPEILAIKRRYNLDCEDIDAIFFTSAVS